MRTESGKAAENRVREKEPGQHNHALSLGVQATHDAPRPRLRLAHGGGGPDDEQVRDGRGMGCHLAIDHLSRKYNAPKEWRKLEAVTATMLSMLLVDLGQEEELMYRVAESFEERCAA